MGSYSPILGLPRLGADTRALRVDRAFRVTLAFDDFWFSFVEIAVGFACLRWVLKFYLWEARGGYLTWEMMKGNEVEVYRC